MVAWGTAESEDRFLWMTNDLTRYCPNADVSMQHVRGIIGVSGHISYLVLEMEMLTAGTS